MENFDTVIKNIQKFAINRKLNMLCNTNDGFNLQLIYTNTSFKVEFLKDRGIFDIYIGFLDIGTVRDIYSLKILAKIISGKSLENTSYEYIKYLEQNLEYIKQQFITNSIELEKGYEVEFKSNFW